METCDELEEEEEEELEEMESDLGEEPLDAIAQYDFAGRNERELTFHKVRNGWMGGRRGMCYCK